MTVTDEERLARVALNRLAEPGDLRFARLVTELGAIELYAALLDQRGPEGVRDDVALRLEAIDPAQVLGDAERDGLRFVVPGDDEWPTHLDDLAHAPPVNNRGGTPLGLWVNGPLSLSATADAVAVVGSRACTSYGESVAGGIAAAVATEDRVVVSGAAAGIDVAAHRGAVSAEGATIAVLACGADEVYPETSRRLLEHLTREGAVVSEAPPGARPHQVRFLARNRLIAGLSCGTVVVEAAARSGALSTANWATGLNRPLLGVPGPVTSASSEGVHEWIRRGAMQLVTGGSDVLEAVSVSGTHLVGARRAPATDKDALTWRQRQVLDAVPVTVAEGAESIARVAGIGLTEVGDALDHLSRTGFVRAGAGGWCLSR